MALKPIGDALGSREHESALQDAASRGDRYRQIAGVLGAHGFGVLIAGLGIDHLMPFDHGAGERVTGPEARAREAREALEELGPTFVKLGQLLASRRDLLPVAYVQEFAKLQDSAVPVPADAVARTIESEFGSPPSELFATFEAEPLASASLGQAHGATLRDGTPVVVKVRRPEAAVIVEEDLEILHHLAARAARYVPDAARYDFPALADEFARSLRAELDYVREAHSADRFAAAFADDPEIHIPRVYWDTTSTRVLTLERITGIKVDDLDALDAAHMDRPAIVRRAIAAIAQMVFTDGFFHADPHPGNLFIQPGGRIALIDFGMVGTIDGPLRERLAALIIAISRNDADRIGAALTGLCDAPRTRNTDQLHDDVVGLMSLYQGRSIGEVQMTPLLARMLTVLRKHRMHLPPDLALLVRMLLLVDTVGARLDPAFNLAAALHPYAARLAAKHLSLRALATRAGRAGIDVAALGVELPERLRRLLETMDTDGLELHLRTSELDPLVTRMERIGNRIVAGMIAAALIGGVGRLTAVSTGRSRSLRAPLLDSGLGIVGVLVAYLAATARRRSP
ncbi:AarF/UbiB family protein [Amnibacterium sp.]|uniref:ABC1 kinase family protein n=1 Tax=Amnibacterium sp. TaxID=1872496 RepID=UPI002609F689|nr:AarF/UbiB family protein [Amnibacterium sp.]MCU1474153.1 ubiB [Amnibacterium sp.]